MTPPMVRDAEAAEWLSDSGHLHDGEVVLDVEDHRFRYQRLLADRAELWAFVKLVRDTGAQHCMPLAEKLLKRKEAHRGS